MGCRYIGTDFNWHEETKVIHDPPSRIPRVEFDGAKDHLPLNDAVNHPAHYTDGGIETIDFIEAKKLNYCTGTAVKYISRAGKKDPNTYVQDLRKAVWFLNREIARVSK